MDWKKLPFTVDSREQEKYKDTSVRNLLADKLIYVYLNSQLLLFMEY